MCNPATAVKSWSFTTLTAILLILALSGAYAAPQYRVAQLPSFEPRAINNSGLIAGHIKPSIISGYSACTWTPSTPNGTTGTFQNVGGFAGYSDAYVTGINNNGVIIGYCTKGNNDNKVFRYTSSGGLQPLDLGDEVTTTAVRISDINDSGAIVGQYGGTGFVWTDTGRLQQLSTLPPPEGAHGGMASPSRINSSGVISGSIQYSFYWPHDYGGYVVLGRASYWDAGGTPHNLGVPVDQSDHHTSSGVSDLNDAGVMLVSWNNHYYRCTPGSGLTELPFPRGLSCFQINNNGVILGGYSTPTNKPFIYSGGVVSELDSLLLDSGWSIQTVHGINDRGQIVAKAYLNGSPILSTVLLNPVPEPSGLLALGTGIFGLAGLIRRKR